MKRGQASFEYVILVGTLLVILIPLFYYAINQSTETIKLEQAEDTVYSLTKAADEIYSLGPGSKKYVWITIPGGVQSTQIVSTEIIMQISIFGETSDIISISNAPLSGEIPTNKGIYKIAVEHLESGIVLIGEGNDTTHPQIVWTSPSDLSCNPITLRATTDESANCNFDTTDQSYNTMTNSMEGSSLGHNYELGVQDQGNYTYFVRCSDAFNNIMNTSTTISYTINFTYCNEGEIKLTKETQIQLQQH